MRLRSIQQTELSGAVAEAVREARRGIPVEIVSEGEVVARIVPTGPLHWAGGKPAGLSAAPVAVGADVSALVLEDRG